MIIRTGIDLIEIQRIEAAIQQYGNRFLHRIFTQRELDVSQYKPESLAARFAAKEAVSKALGCGIGEVGWLDIEIVSDNNRQPSLVLHNRALQISQEHNLFIWSISLSHSLHTAAAIAVAIGEENPRLIEPLRGL